MKIKLTLMVRLFLLARLKRTLRVSFMERKKADLQGQRLGGWQGGPHLRIVCEVGGAPHARHRQRTHGRARPAGTPHAQRRQLVCIAPMALPRAFPQLDPGTVRVHSTMYVAQHSRPCMTDREVCTPWARYGC